MDKKTQAVENLKKFAEQEEAAKKELAGNRDQILLKQMLEEDKDLLTNSNTFVNPNIEWKPTDKYRVAMIMPPSWTIFFPPYGIAKLTALMRHYGYSVKVYDANVESYHHLLKEHEQDYWKTERHFLWSIKENFETYLLPDIKHILDSIINEIINDNVRVVGLSLYTTNVIAGIYIAKKLRKLKPDICLLAGGPETITNTTIFEHEAHNLFNYIFVGESEDNLINLLENLPNELPLNETIGTVKSRLNLEHYPYADYTDYDLKNYTQHGVSIETSRGCIAQCSFCSETYFWKFRSQEANRVVDEIEHYVKTYKAKRFWFTDSLANGNLKNFEKIVDLIRERRLDIRWHSYARCDGRMDAIFLHKVAASGCTALSYGVESGSQKVLNDMRKKIEIWEIENNLKDSRKAGMYNHVNYMVGYPTEEPVDWFHGMQVIYNTRKWIGALSLGYTTTMAKNAHIETNYRTYGVVGEGDIYDYSSYFLGDWYTDNYKNTIVNRFLRLKFGYIWLEILKDFRQSVIYNSQQQDTMKSFYNFEFNNKTSLEYVEQDFYVNFNQFENSFADNIANEYIAMCYMLYKYFNRVSFTFRCDPEEDLKIFGNYITRNYYSDLQFNTDKKGNYTFILKHKLIDQFEETVSRQGHISEWQTLKPIVRETVHPQYRD